MKNYYRILILAVLISFGFQFKGSAQYCDTIANLCNEHIGSKFISDGQFYRALLNSDEIAEFKTTLFGGSTYRIASCSGLSDGNMIFSLLDEERNVLFSNKDHLNAPYWDFKVESTVNCIVEGRLDLTRTESGCAVMLIGFKQ